MAEESDIRIIAWPDSDLALKHTFEPEQPCPVSVSFEDTPINVRVGSGEKPLDVDMNMHVEAREPVPLCISICEPICARSEYQITFDIFDQPVGRIVVRGMTRLFNCDDEPKQPRPTLEERCVDFTRYKEGQSFDDRLVVGGAEFSPLEGGALKVVMQGEPAGRSKLLIPETGVLVRLPQPADRIVVTVTNGSDEALEFTAYAGDAAAESVARTVGATPTPIAIAHPGLTGLGIRHGASQAAVVELCWYPSAPIG